MGERVIMNYVQPIRAKAVIDDMKIELMKNNYRDYFLFIIGINTGFRVSDILELKVSDVKGGQHIIIKEKKTGKTKRAYVSKQLKKDIDKYTANMGENEYLFPSQKGNKPIGRVQAYRILNNAAKKVGLDEIGTHTLRKTFGYWHYKQHKDVAVLQELFNHSSPSITKLYIGIRQDEIDNTMKDFYL